MNELNFRIETVKEEFRTVWEAQLGNDKPRRHADPIKAIMLTGISFGDLGISEMIAKKLKLIK